MPLPSLPQHDPDPAARAEALAREARAYAYDRSYLDALFVRDVPLAERYDPRYVAAAAEVAAELMANRASQRTDAWPASTGLAGELQSHAPEVFVAGVARVLATTNRLPRARPTEVSGYDDLFARTGLPRAHGRHDDDAFFAWRQVAGMTPMTLRGLDALPDNLRLDAATYARARGGERLDEALAEGRLFAVDYAALDGITAGTSDGLPKHLYAPIAVFVRGGDGGLAPVAVQMTQRPARDERLWTPADGLAWRMAKATVNNAEMTYNGVIAHFARCHLTAEALVCISRSRLAPTHPLLHLLAPHFRYTLAVNATARESIVSPGGTQEYLLGGTLSSNFEVAARVVAAVRYDAAGLRADLAARRVDDPARLPRYPYRDDGLPVADALRRWAEAYLRVYYPNDDAVRGDPELHAWAAALAGDGRMGAMPALDGLRPLAALVGDLLWLVTGYHAVINYGGWGFAAWAPETPSALFGPGPREGATDDDWRAMLPPLSVANGMLEQMRSLERIRINRLGDYPDGHFDDPRVQAPLAALRAELDAAAPATAARDAARPWSFPYLHPANIPNSIHV